MRRALKFGLIVVLVGLMPGSGASAADKTFQVSPGGRLDWDGAVATGTNYYYWDPAGAGAAGPLTPTQCTKGATSYCEQVLVQYSNPLTQAEIDAGKKSKSKSSIVTLDTFTAPGGPVQDFDLLAYESDANGTRGTLLVSDGNLQNTTQETVTFSITTTPTAPSKWVLIDIVYYQVVNGSYKGHVTF